jgi:hypothetical protein
VEAGRIGRVDHPGDVDHRLGAVDQPGQRRPVVQVAADPFDARRLGLRAPGQRAQGNAQPGGLFAQRATDETGRAGDGDDALWRHSRTSWSRWITAARGA